MKLYDIVLAAQPLQKLVNQDLPLREAYKVAMLATRVNPHLEFYGAELAKGKFEDDLNDFDVSDFDTVEPIELSLALDLKLSAADIKRLEPFVTFTDGGGD